MHITAIRQALADQVTTLRLFLRTTLHNAADLATAEAHLDALTSLREGMPADWVLTPPTPNADQIAAAWSVFSTNAPWRTDHDFLRWYVAMVEAAPIPAPWHYDCTLEPLTTPFMTGALHDAPRHHDSQPPACS